MATRSVIVLKDAVKSFILNEEIRKIASETGCVKRERKVDIVKLFWSLILSFGVGRGRNLSDINRTFNMTAGSDRVVKSAFYDRFSEDFTRFMKSILDNVCSKMAEPSEDLKKMLKAFRDLVLIDSTLLKLHDLLEKAYPASGRMGGNKPVKAEAKLQLVMSATANAPKFMNLSPGKQYEGKTIEIGDWVAGRLLLADLGYFSFKYFMDIAQHGGYFISRTIWSFNPYIIGDNLPDGKLPIFYLGQRIQEILSIGKWLRHKRVFDLEVALCKHCASSGNVMCTMRVVCIWNPRRDCYNCYLTNIPPNTLSAEEIGRTYAARWEIEMIFKELKSFYRLDQFPTKKDHIIEALIYAALLSFILSRYVLNSLRKGYDIRPSRSPERRFAAAFFDLASRILHVMFSKWANNGIWREHEYYLVTEMMDPNRKRDHNLSILRN